MRHLTKFLILTTLLTCSCSHYSAAKEAGDIIKEGFDSHENNGSILSTPANQDNSANILSTPINENDSGNILSTPVADNEGVKDQGFGVGSDVPDTSILYNDSLVTEEREIHILDGDSTGGGHRYGTGIPGKSELPKEWSDDKIMNEISDIATDPSAKRTPSRGGRTVIDSTRDGIDVRVVVDKNGNIITGFPTNVPRN
jgi:hypothetical protein